MVFGLLLCLLLAGQVVSLEAQDRGNTTAQEYGDAVYRQLDPSASFGYDYNHTAIFAGLDSGNNGNVLQALGSGYVTHEEYFNYAFRNYGSAYYGAYTLNNRTMTFTDRRNVVTTAIGLVNAAIPYPSTFLEIPVCIVYYGGSFDGTIADISNIRCDGFVEYCYEKNNFRVWRNQLYVDSAWSIVLYPDLNNDRPDITRNPEDEASPWAQRGAPCATGPNTGFGCSYLAPDTKMTTPAVMNLPTYQVTTNGGPGYLDVTIQATDASGIHLIAVVKPGEASWTYSPTQPQHPTSASYSWTTRITNSGTLYYAAIDNGGNAPTVAQTPSVTLNVPPPSIPTATAATSITNSGFTANWNAASGATGYRLDVSTSSTFASYVSGYQNLDVGSVTIWSVTGLAGNTIHYYRVRAYNSGGTSGNSGTITATTLPNPPPAPTANAATSVTANSFSANWSSASGATGYRLDVSTDNTFSSYVSGYQDLNVANVTTKSVSGLSAGTNYYYRVRAFNTGGTSGDSSTMSVSTIPTSPTANAASTVTNTGFVANWSNTDGATGYRLDVSISSTFVSFVAGFQNLDVGNVISKSVTGLSANTTHYYRLRAYNTGGTSGNSGTITVATLPNSPPVPTATAATAVTNISFNANWSAASGATGYRLDIATDNAFSSYVSGYQDLDVGNVTTKSVTGLNPGTTLYYRIRAYNTGGTSGNSSTITVLLVPAAPTANAATGVTNSAFTANWSGSTGATGYRLDVSTNGAFSNFVSGYQNADVGNVLSRNVTNLSAATIFYYRVRAYNGSGTSTNSGTIAATTTTPSIAFTRQDNNLVLSWPTNDPAFKLYYTTNLPAAAWISNPVSPPVVSGQYTITNGMTNNARFFRLKK
jgi:phosphodiesterase/alkaline phosphatase D-like protein